MTPASEQWLEAGDPTFLGWFISAIYLLAAVLALRAWWKYRSYGSGLQAGHPQAAGCQRLAMWWLGVAVLLILLGVNKELDLLQKLVRVWGRNTVISHGWYASRGMLQRAFVASLVLLLAGAGGIALYFFRSVATRILPSLLGVSLVLAYAMLKTAMFNGLRDAMPAQLAAALWLLEPAGVLLVILCAERVSHGGAQPS